MERFLGRKWLDELGFKGVEANPMAEQVEMWWAWYTTTAAFYESSERINKRTFKVKRKTIKPAKMVCEDWASLLFNERTQIGISDVVTSADGKQSENAAFAPVNEWLQDWLADTDFMKLANRTIERAMALGTAGWALRIDGLNADGTYSESVRIIPERYDARHIVPLSFRSDVCTECMFQAPVVVDGKKVNQLTAFVLGNAGTYTIHTAFFTDSGKRMFFDGYTESFETNITTPPFALVRPAIDNNYLDYHPFGVSVFDEALGVVEMLDMAIDNLNRDIYLGQKMVFLPDSMLEKDAKGNVVIPRAADQQVFMAFEGDATLGDKTPEPYEYNPDLRVDENRMAIKTALELLGKRCGFGKDYYSLDERGGGTMRNKTATEVASDQSELMRNIKKHEESISPALEQICEAAIELANRLLNTNFPSVAGHVVIVYGDSIIEDDTAIRERDRADVALGLMAGWQYIAKWQAIDEASAKEIWAETQGLPSELS